MFISYMSGPSSSPAAPFFACFFGPINFIILNGRQYNSVVAEAHTYFRNTHKTTLNWDYRGNRNWQLDLKKLKTPKSGRGNARRWVLDRTEAVQRPAWKLPNYWKTVKYGWLYNSGARVRRRRIEMLPTTIFGVWVFYFRATTVNRQVHVPRWWYSLSLGQNFKIF